MPSVARASGPNTVEGKRKVSQNARKHGFRAQVQILSPIQEAEIAETIQFFARDFPPQSAVDDAVLSQLGKAFWTLQQFDNLEAQQYISPNYEEAVRRLSTLTRYRAPYERLFHKAMEALHSTNKLRLKRTPTRPNSHKQTAHAPLPSQPVKQENPQTNSSPEVGRTPGRRGTPSCRLHEYTAMPRAGRTARNRGVTQEAIHPPSAIVASTTWHPAAPPNRNRDTKEAASPPPRPRHVPIRTNKPIPTPRSWRPQR